MQGGNQKVTQVNFLGENGEKSAKGIKSLESLPLSGLIRQTIN